MLLDARTPEKPAGILIDKGTGRRIPFARTVDFDKGTYEALQATADGKDYLCDDNNPIVVRGRAVGELELVPIENASSLGVEPPKKVNGTILPMTADQRIEGLHQYKRIFSLVWNQRGEAMRCVNDRFEEYLRTTTFLDCFVLKRRSVKAGE